jgi:exodeoxyribonuclease V
MGWSPQQETAIKAVNAWLRNPRAPQVFRLFGYAGTGKTTLAKHLVEDVAGQVLYMAFTGKAALQLRKKGCTGASTIHSAIYKPDEDPLTGETHFVLNPDSGVAHAALVVVDEVSMVGEELAEDLLSFGTKILVLGDPAQLPPVKGEGFFINAAPDVMLTEIHRQAEESPIIRMSMDIREGRRLQPGTYGESRVILRKDIGKDELCEMVQVSDQLICGLNKTRHAFNARVRQIKGLAGADRPWYPTAGDRLVCLRNDKEKGLFNGGLWNTGEVSYSGGPVGLLDIRVHSLDEPDKAPVDVTTPQAFFNGTEKDLDWRARRNSDEFTFGWALTCHKSQGSGWDYPLVFDESSVFREDAKKWLYTAVTRAAEKVTVIL